MDYRFLGRSGLKVPVLSFGAGTFGGTGPLFGAWGNTDVEEARRLVDICLEAGVTLFDTADVYSSGASEQVLGASLRGRRDSVLISTKISLPTGEGPNDAGSSRFRLIRAVEDALKRLDTDHIDLLQLHAFDAGTPVEEVLFTLDTLVQAVACTRRPATARPWRRSICSVSSMRWRSSQRKQARRCRRWR